MQILWNKNFSQHETLARVIYMPRFKLQEFSIVSIMIQIICSLKCENLNHFQNLWKFTYMKVYGFLYCSTGNENYQIHLGNMDALHIFFHFLSIICRGKELFSFRMLCFICCCSFLDDTTNRNSWKSTWMDFITSYTLN